MREHCRTQHGFDPSPTPDAQTISYLERQNNKAQARKPDTASNLNTVQTSGAADKLLKTLRNYLTFQEQGIRNSAKQPIMESIDSALDYLTDNFVIMKRKDIAGISGHICYNCLTFQYQFIKDIGFDLTAKERHRCAPFVSSIANQIGGKLARQLQLRNQAIQNLVTLTNSLFTGSKHLLVNSSLSPAFLANIHAPLIELDSVYPEHWAWNRLARKKVALSDLGVKNFIMRAVGTYALVHVKSGVHNGYHLMSLQNPYELVGQH